MSNALENVLEYDQYAKYKPRYKGPKIASNSSVGNGPAKIFVIDDEYLARASICDDLRDAGWEVEAFSSCEAFLSDHQAGADSCIVLDIHFPGMDGMELLRRMGGWASRPPTIIMSGSSGINEAVQSMKQGALDFIEKPVEGAKLVASVRRALSQRQRADGATAQRDEAKRLMGELTKRQRQIMALVLDGQPSKNIAADLCISQRTVENHRAAIMQRMGARSLPALARLVMCIGCSRGA